MLLTPLLQVVPPPPRSSSRSALTPLTSSAPFPACLSLYWAPFHRFQNISPRLRLLIDLQNIYDFSVWLQSIYVSMSMSMCRSSFYWPPFHRAGSRTLVLDWEYLTFESDCKCCQSICECLDSFPSHTIGKLSVGCCYGYLCSFYPGWEAKPVFLLHIFKENIARGKLTQTYFSPATN